MFLIMIFPAETGSMTPFAIFGFYYVFILRLLWYSHLIERPPYENKSYDEQR